MDATSTVVVGTAALVTLIGGILGIAVAFKVLFHKPVDPGKDYVVREELNRALDSIERKFDELKKNVVDRMDKISDSAKETANSQTSSMNIVQLKLERLLVLHEIGSATIRKIPEVVTETK